MNVGHCRPDAVQAIQDQAAKLIHACIHVAIYEPYIALCEKLVPLLPHGDKTKTMLNNSGQNSEMILVNVSMFSVSSRR